MLTICICRPDNKFRVLRGNKIIAGPFARRNHASSAAANARRPGERINPHLGRHDMPPEPVEAKPAPAAKADDEALDADRLLMTAKGLIDYVQNHDLTVADLTVLLHAEKGGRNRKTVKRAIQQAIDSQK